ncbi:MAG: hypothetical protein IKB73_02905, partial [Ruminococcus sp.]|nr:hypothetical protein [Ruminococcus sp.]
MAKHDNDFVDINSSSQVTKLYKKRLSKGRGTRIFVLILSIIMLVCGSGMIYYYTALDNLNYQEVENKPLDTDSDDSNTVK